MKTKLLGILGATILLGGCSSMNPWSDSRMVEIDQRKSSAALEVPRYMLEAQPSTVGVGEGRATNPQTARDLADHYAKVDLCRKLGVAANSRVRTTAAQTSKGARSATSVTGTVASETTCAAMVANPEVLDTATVQQGVEYITWVRISSDDVSAQLNDTFDATDASTAAAARVR